MPSARRGLRRSRFVGAAVKGRRAGIRCGVLGLVTLVLAGLGAPAAHAHPRHHGPELTVMTRNLYLGASLTPAVTAPDAKTFLGSVAAVYQAAQASNFPARAQAIAGEVAANRPDIVGLQEVTNWVTSGPGVPPNQDFLAILRAALADQHLHYVVAVTSDNANIGPVPLVQPCASEVTGACLVTLQDRDVILVNADTPGLRWSNARHGNYTAQQTFTPPVAGGTPVSFNRGWVSIDGSYRGKRFHLASTHLETAANPPVQEAQAAEFLAGPARGRGTDIALGDFNSAADGSTTATYAALTMRFRDAWRVNHTARRDLLSRPDPGDSHLAARQPDRPDPEPARREGRRGAPGRDRALRSGCAVLAVRPRRHGGHTAVALTRRLRHWTGTTPAMLWRPSR